MCIDLTLFLLPNQRILLIFLLFCFGVGVIFSIVICYGCVQLPVRCFRRRPFYKQYLNYNIWFSFFFLFSFFFFLFLPCIEVLVFPKTGQKTGQRAKQVRLLRVTHLLGICASSCSSASLVMSTCFLKVTRRWEPCRTLWWPSTGVRSVKVKTF